MSTMVTIDVIKRYRVLAFSDDPEEAIKEIYALQSTMIEDGGDLIAVETANALLESNSEAKVVIGKPINDISLNGLEYLLDENGVRVFDTMLEAEVFLERSGITGASRDWLTVEPYDVERHGPGAVAGL